MTLGRSRTWRRGRARSKGVCTRMWPVRPVAYAAAPSAAALYGATLGRWEPLEHNNRTDAFQVLTVRPAGMCAPTPLRQTLTHTVTRRTPVHAGRMRSARRGTPVAVDRPGRPMGARQLPKLGRSPRALAH